MQKTLTFSVSIQAPRRLEKDMLEMFPKALGLLKSLCEGKAKSDA